MVICLISVMPCYSQLSVIPQINSRDTLPPEINWNAPVVQKSFPYRTFIIPTALVAYGFVSLHNNDLRKLNLKVKEEASTITAVVEIHAEVMVEETAVVEMTVVVTEEDINIFF